MFGSRAARTARGAIAALVATLAASVSHSVADGAPAPAIGVILALIIAVPTCIALAGRRLSWLRLTAAVSLSQFAFHGLLLVGVGSGTGAEATATGHLHGAGLSAALEGTATALHDGHTGPAMWIAHVLAAVVTILVLGRGEQAVRALASLAGWDLAVRILDWRPAPVRTAPSSPTATPRAPAPRIVLSAVRRRGPPLAA